jgi:hypothetical protein
MTKHKKEYKEKKNQGIPTRVPKEHNHGTVNKYQSGCRCEECSNASYHYHKARREKQNKLKKLLQSSDLFDSIT